MLLELTEGLALAKAVARKACGRMPHLAHEREEITAIANLALVQSAHEWDAREPETRKVTFRAYAGWRMKHAIFDALRAGHLGGMKVLRYKGQVKRRFEVISLDDPDCGLVVRVNDRFDRAIERRDLVEKCLQRVEPRAARILWNTVALEQTVLEASLREGLSQARGSQLRQAAIISLKDSDGTH